MSAHNARPTTSELAQIAASIDSKLSPEEAITRARALWEAAHRASCAGEIKTDESELPAECEHLERVGLGLPCKEISLSQAFCIAATIADKWKPKFKPYKKENTFAAAMRAAKLTCKRPIYDKTIEEWATSNEPERPIVGAEEYTSSKAVEELYRLKAEQRQRRDRKRKAASKSRKARKRKIDKIFCGTKDAKSGSPDKHGDEKKKSQAERRAEKRNT
jgi:hypothetical protein